MNGTVPDVLYRKSRLDVSQIALKITHDFLNILYFATSSRSTINKILSIVYSIS